MLKLDSEYFVFDSDIERARIGVASYRSRLVPNNSTRVPGRLSAQISLDAGLGGSARLSRGNVTAFVRQLLFLNNRTVSIVRVVFYRILRLTFSLSNEKTLFQFSDVFLLENFSL